METERFGFWDHTFLGYSHLIPRINVIPKSQAMVRRLLNIKPKKTTHEKILSI